MNSQSVSTAVGLRGMKPEVFMEPFMRKRYGKTHCVMMYMFAMETTLGRIMPCDANCLRSYLRHWRPRLIQKSILPLICKWEYQKRKKQAIAVLMDVEQSMPLAVAELIADAEMESPLEHLQDDRWLQLWYRENVLFVCVSLWDRWQFQPQY